MDAFSTFSSQLLVVLAFGAIRAITQRFALVIALALVLRGSKPGDRPALLDAIATCLSYWPPRTGLQRRKQS